MSCSNASLPRKKFDLIRLLDWAEPKRVVEPLEELGMQLVNRFKGLSTRIDQVWANLGSH